MNRAQESLKDLAGLWPYFLAWSLALVGLVLGIYFFQDELQLYLVGERYVPKPVERVTGLFRRYQIGGPILYAVFFGIVSSLFVPAWILAAAAGILFNPYVGISVVMVGLLISAQTFYWLGRFGGNSILGLFSDRILNVIYDFLPQRTGRVVLLCRLVFFMPFHAFNAVSGVLKVPWVPYNIATFVGLFPRMWVYLYLGISLKPDHGNITLAAVYLLTLVIVESIYGALLLQLYLNRQKISE